MQKTLVFLLTALFFFSVPVLATAHDGDRYDGGSKYYKSWGKDRHDGKHFEGKHFRHDRHDQRHFKKHFKHHRHGHRHAGYSVRPVKRVYVNRPAVVYDVPRIIFRIDL